MNANEKWDERYKHGEFAYGREPNTFFKEWLPKFAPGTILMPADGEGRNSVFAARLGWQVTSFDLSVEGRLKALQLAGHAGVALEYIVADFDHLSFKENAFDAIGMVYAHFPGGKKAVFHHKLHRYLKPGGVIIFEAFGKNHLHFKKLNPKVGGPGDIGMLYSKEEITADFENYEILVMEEAEVNLNEGIYHVGTGSVIRFVGIKK